MDLTVEEPDPGSAFVPMAAGRATCVERKEGGQECREREVPAGMNPQKQGTLRTYAI